MIPLCSLEELRILVTSCTRYFNLLTHSTTSMTGELLTVTLFGITEGVPPNFAQDVERERIG
jgi:hypothetical protein